MLKTHKERLAAMALGACFLAVPLGALAEDFSDLEEGAPLLSATAFDRGLRAYDLKNYEKAFALWLPLAQASDLAAQRNIAHMLRRGLGVRRDPQRALALYERAAEAGLVSAALNAGVMRLKGDGVPCDQKKAVRWIRHAANHGHPVAQFYMGRIYERGYGVRQDILRAIGWYWISKEKGYHAAAERLLELRPPEITPEIFNQEKAS